MALVQPFRQTGHPECICQLGRNQGHAPNMQGWGHLFWQLTGDKSGTVTWHAWKRCVYPLFFGLYCFSDEWPLNVPLPHLKNSADESGSKTKRICNSLSKVCQTLCSLSCFVAYCVLAITRYKSFIIIDRNGDVTINTYLCHFLGNALTTAGGLSKWILWLIICISMSSIQTHYNPNPYEKALSSSMKVSNHL